MKFFDDKTKKLYWWNRNYFYVGTTLWIFVNFLLFACLGNNWGLQGNYESQYYELITFHNIGVGFLNSFRHFDWGHVLGNMICLLIVGLYLERKQGTLGFIFLIPIMAFFTSIAICANNLNNDSAGFSGVNYGLYAWIIVDYIFSLRKDKRAKTNIIFGAVILFIIYFATTCVDFNTFKFTWYPYDLLYNMGHYSSFLVSTILVLLVNICQLKVLKEYGNQTISKAEPINKNQSTLKLTDNSNGIRKIKEVGKNDLKKKLSKPYKVVYISALALCLAVSGTTIGCCVAASQRQHDSTVYIECNFEDYNAAYNFKFGEHFYYDFVVSNWQKEKSLDSDIIYELYYDKEYKNAISEDEQIEDLSYWYWYWNFVPLSYSPNYTVYIKIIIIS